MAPPQLSDAFRRLRTALDDQPSMVAREGIQLSALSDYDVFGDGPQGLMFGYAAAPERLVAPALRRLKEIWS